MMRVTRLLPFALLLAAPLGAQRDTLGLRPAFRLIDQYAMQMMQEAGTPGLALALVDRRGLLTVRTYGWADRERRIPVSADTRFQIGSISKSFTAIALMQLRAEGRFDPMLPAQRYLPWFTPKTQWRPVTGHDLMTHTSGLTRDRDDIPSSPAQAWKARERTMGSAPGARWDYSNIGWQVMGQILMKLDGGDYGEIIRRRILTPLGMTHTDPTFSSATRLSMAKAYTTLYDDRPEHPGDPQVEAPWIEYGSGDGALVSTAPDMARCLTMLLNRGATPTGRILEETDWQRISAPHARTGDGPDDGTYGYGMFGGTLDGKPVFSHSGGMLGFSSMLLGEPRLGIGAVAFVNGPGSAGGVARFAVRALAAAMTGDSLPALPAPANPVAVGNAADYAGTYTSPAGDSLVFAASGDSLLLVHDGTVALLTYGDDTFLGPRPAFARFPIAFHRDSTGAVTEVAVGGAWYRSARYHGPTRWTTPKLWDAYVGHYRIMQPWEPNFRIIHRKGRLYWVSPGGEEEVLTLLPDGEYRVGDPLSAERIRFGPVVDGQVLQVTFSGMEYYRYFVE